MHFHNTRYICLWLGVLLLSNHPAAWAHKWKYLPAALEKPAKIATVINPALTPGVQQRLATLDLAFEVNLARAKARWFLQHPAPVSDFTVQRNPGNPCPARFLAFATWLDRLIDSKKLLANRQTIQALQTLRQAMESYSFLDASEQAQVNLAFITLNPLRFGKLGKFPNDDFYKIEYHPAANEGPLPQAQRFHLKLERRGMFKQYTRTQRTLKKPTTSFTFATDYENPEKIIGLTLLQGFQPAATRQELEQVLDALTPPGYILRMSTHELGLSSSRQKFRQGFLHIHFEKTNARPGTIPTNISIELWIGATPYTGIIDIKTRKIIVPFDDKKIAQHYLTLFDKYLTPAARQTLEYIAR